MVQEVGQAQPGVALVPASIWGRAHRQLTIGLILTVSGTAFEALAVATTLPATVRDLGGLALYGWAFSAFMLANLIGIILTGAEADRHGPARPFVAGSAVFMLGLLVVGLAPSMAVVIAGRAVQGFGAGVLSSVAYVSIGRGYPESLKPRMLAVTSSAWVVPGLIGPALAGLIADTVGWRWVFLGLVPLLIVGAALALPGLRRLTGGSQTPREWGTSLAALALTGGAGLALAGLGAKSLPIAAALVVGGLALSLPALRRLLPPGTLRAAPGLPAAVAAHGLLNLAFFGVDSFVPLALTSRGQSVTVAGLALTAATIFWTAGAWVQAHLAVRTSRRTMVAAGLALIAAGIAGIAATLAPGVPLLVAPLAWGVAGLGMGFAFSTNALVVLENAPPGQEGSASSALQLANVLGVALGAGLGGAIIGNASGAASVARAGLLTQDALMFGLALLTILLARRLPDRAPQR